MKIHNTPYIIHNIINNKRIVMNREYIYDQCGVPHFTTVGLLPNDKTDLANIVKHTTHKTNKTPLTEKHTTHKYTTSHSLLLRSNRLKTK